MVIERRILLAGGGALLALAAGLMVGGLLMSSHGGKAKPPPASAGGLVIDPGLKDAGRIDATAPLRCFVAGKFVGQFSLADCARRNGVATGALDVGVDETGALAAADPGGAEVTPLPPKTAGDPVLAVVAGDAPAGVPTASCWRYADGQWRKLPSEVTVGGCAQALFAGRCEAQGGATYGRWGQQTLRLVPGKVEVSTDNRSFRTLMEQAPNCSLPAG